MTKISKQHKPNENHQDLFGRRLEIGRYVAVAWSQPGWRHAVGRSRTHLSVGKIVRFTPKMTEVEVNSGANSKFIIKSTPKNMLMLENEPDLFLWLLTNGV